MKTILPPSEFDSVLSSSNGGVVNCVSSKTTEDSNQGQNNIFDCQTQGDNRETDTLICSSDLTSAFERGKLDKNKIRPGHYLQKVFFNYSVAHKLKSQSLPCVQKNKCPEVSSVKDCNKVLLRNESSVNDSISENAVRVTFCCDHEYIDSSSCNPINEAWFKTWPERTVGFDKKQVKQNEDQSNYQGKIESNCDPLLDKRNNLELWVEPEKKELVKTEPQELFVRPSDHPSSCVGNSPVHLNRVLENIPLGYSPVTKQLHIIKSTSSNIESPRENGLKFSISSCSNNSSVKFSHGNVGTINNVCSPSGNTHNKPVPNSDPVITVTGNVNSSCNLTRVATDTSCCSYSSTLSSLSDVSPSTNDDSALGSLLGLDHGDSCSLASIGECSILSEDSSGTTSTSAVAGLKQKKKSFSGFFSRNVFGWKSSSGEDGSSSQSNPMGGIVRSGSSTGWKLFSRSNASAGSTLCRSGHSGYESGGGSNTPGSPCSVRSSNSIGCVSTSSRVRSHENIIASSSALIQLDRPACLPAKSQEELEKHRQQYQDIVDAAKKKELKEVKQRKRQLQLQLRIEEQQAQAARTWSQDILPRWESMCINRKTKELWWMGIPPCVRGKVWRLAISNELNLTQQLFDICCLRARDMLKTVDINENPGNESTDNKEASVQLIQLDISRTFPNLCIFQQGGPYYDMLHCLLGAYVCYRPDVGYVQGMSFIAAVLILNMDVCDAFICFANLLNRPCLMAFFSLNQSLMQAYYATYNDLLSENLPYVHKHFVASNLTSDLYLLDWIYTVFTKAMNLDLACRVWDVFLRDGEEFLFRAALGVLHLCQDTLLKMDFVHGSQYLTKLPDDLPADQLFKSISSIRMNVGKQTFEQILAFHSQEQGCLNIH